jgi:acyl-coenzyme A synthetase/AMP-(fatty) acid ligase
MAVIDFYDRGWGINPSGIAYIQDERSYTFAEVGELSCRIANKLLGIASFEGDKGAVWSTNDVTAWSCTLGLWRANMTWLPINARNSIEENIYCPRSLRLRSDVLSKRVRRCHWRGARQAAEGQALDMHRCRCRRRAFAGKLERRPAVDAPRSRL